MDKIIPIWRNKGDITDAETGRDLILELTKAKTPKGAVYTVIQTIMHDDPAPLSNDKELSDSWVNDPTTWNDVYAKKPLEYLEAIAIGETPRWDSEKGGYVYGDSSSSESSFGGTTNREVLDPQYHDEPADDMPF